MKTNYFLFDTCVWLTLAQDADAVSMLQVLKRHVDGGTVVLLVPKIVIEEFDRNRSKIITRQKERLKTCVKHAREASALLDGNAGEEMRQLAEKADKRISEKASALAVALTMASDLMRHSSSVEIIAEDDHSKRVVERALAKRAPFHRQKNSVADALHMECFNAWVTRNRRIGKAVFVSENTSDYCDEKNRAKIHPDYAEFFIDQDVSFSINVAEVIADLGEFEHSAAVTQRYATVATVASNVCHIIGTPSLLPSNACPKGGDHSFSQERGAYLRSQYGGLTWQLICDKCGARFDTGDSWD